MGNSKIPAYGYCGHEPIPVVRTVSAPIKVVDYSSLLNKPQIGGVELVGNKTLGELGLADEAGEIAEEILDAMGLAVCSDQDIEDLFNN